MEQLQTTPGAVALVGAGEYLAVMNETDRYLLGTLGGPAAARVVLLPTASGLEPGSPARWNRMGQTHYANLGVTDVRPSMIIDAASAHDPAQVDLLRGANFFYFSGGNPQHTIDALRGSPAWEVISAAHAQGAVLAGCSAGAMAFGGVTVGLRLALSNGPVQWSPALGIVPNVTVFPHFDRMMGSLSRTGIRTGLVKAPDGITAIGVDEDTALVRLSLATADQPARWRVMGHKTVTIFWRGRDPETLKVGAEVAL
ncbi:MAG: Type 1 glutamine amidotransferase-like domain-containing protein [Ktedonobacterales bacterium]|nr:Type 1 glutamine amidotransferase-like domain-containing protein [Ktedonobacterales bacterium]